MEKKKIRIGKIILIILAIVILGVLIHTIRNFIIISKLQDTFKQYADVDNYHIKTVYDDENTGHTETNYYRKGDKKAFFIENVNLSGEVARLLTYDSGKRVDFFTETIDEKNAFLGTASSPKFAIDNGIMTDNLVQKILSCFLAKVRSVKYTERDCYEITNFMSANLLYDDNETTVSIVDKETALELSRKWNANRTEERLTEINNVDDSVFVEPNIAEYEIKENNT